MQSLSVAKPIFYVKQEDIFEGGMAFAETSWEHTTGPKAMIAFGQPVIDFSLSWPHQLRKTLVFKEIESWNMRG